MAARGRPGHAEKGGYLWNVHNLTAGETYLELNGTGVTLLTYNGTYPGPIIRAKAGESLKISLTNNLGGFFTGTNILGHDRGSTNLHTHGLHVSPKDKADNMMRMAEPGDLPLDYVYDLSKEGPGHLNFYHPHVHGTVAEQYWGDVVIIPKRSATLLVPVMDWDGMAMFHCHIIEHDDIGMMGVWDIMMM